MHPRTCLITGGTHGIGLEVCRRLARAGDVVVLHAPTPPEAQAAVDRLVRDGADPGRLSPVAADFRRLGDVLTLARHLQRRHTRLDLLVNNAGIVAPPHRTLTGDGHETTLQVDYLAHYALTRMLGRPLNNAAGRVVTVTSALHRLGRLDFNDPTLALGYRPVDAYARAQLALTVFNQALAHAAEHRITAVAVHPGSIDTGPIGAIHGHGGLAPADGAAAVLHAADPATAVVNGGYYEGMLPAEPATAGRDVPVADAAWHATARLLGWDYTAARDLRRAYAG